MPSRGDLSRQLDWNDVRFFLAVARKGTLSSAARSLEVDQTTVGRRIVALEGRLHLALFRRSASGLELTAAGSRVLQTAERMEESALELSSGLLAESRALTTVRIATTESLAEVFIMPAVRSVQAAHPYLSVVVNTGWARVDLRRGEADLAVRLVRPNDSRLASRKLADFALRLYASADYVARRGQPTSLGGHSLIAYEEAIRLQTRHPFIGLPMQDGWLALTSNSHQVLLSAARAGLGIVEFPSYVGDQAPDLVRVMPHLQEPYSVWLVVPQANRRLAGVRAVVDSVVRVFKAKSLLERRTG